MDKAEIANLQQQSVANITEQLPSLDRASLIELAALETASETPRTTLQANIDKQLAALDAAADGDKNENDPPIPPAVGDGQGKPAAKPAAGKLTKADYRHPEYDGPLTGEQANWRCANIKPVEKVITK